MNENANAAIILQQMKRQNQGNSTQITSLVQARMGMRALSLSGHSIVQAIPRDDDDILLSLDDGG